MLQELFLKKNSKVRKCSFKAKLNEYKLGAGFGKSGKAEIRHLKSTDTCSKAMPCRIKIKYAFNAAAFISVFVAGV